MKPQVIASALALGLLVFPASAADTAPAASLEELDKRLAATFAKGEVPGASVTVIEGGQVVFTKGYGYADLKTKRPVTPETVFRAGSISKSFTSIGIMLLVEEGKLSLDTKLADLMPELRFANPWESTHPVRLVHLLEHTTGFDDIEFRHYLLEGKDVPLAKAVDLYGPYKSRWRPGTMTSYCNSGPVIAGRIIEKVSGQAFAEFMASRLMGPLAMESAYWTREPQISDRLSKSYRDTEGTEQVFSEILARPSGSLNVTSKDLAKLPLLMLGRGTLDGRAYFTPATAERIERPETTDAARAGLKYGYGLGNVIYTGKKAIFYGHDGAVDGFVSKYEYAPGHGLGFVLMVNLGTAEFQAAASEIKNYLERNLPAVNAAAQPLPVAEVKQWAGYYQSITPRQQKLALIDSLTRFQTSDTAGGSLLLNGTRRVHLGGGIFKREDRAAPTTIFVSTPDGALLHTPVGTDRKLPLWELSGKVFGAGAFALTMALSTLYMLLWIPSAFLGRLASRGGITIRLFPAMAILSVVALAGVTLYALGTNDLEVLGKPHPLGWAIYALTLAVPTLGALSLLRTAMGSPANLFVRTLAWLSSLVVLACAGYLYAYGWIGMKIWE